MRIGVDIGGTFTDIVVETDDGTHRTWKTSSTPPDFAEGLLDGVDIAARELGLDRGALLRQTGHLVHGTTVTTNVILTRTGQRVGLITTRGFGDTYAIARQYRGQEQDPVKVTHPVPLVDPADITEVTERIDYAGTVVASLNEEELREAVTHLHEQGIDAFAVCFLWSFVNPAHEARTKEIITELVPGAYVSASFEACPIAGEYERTSTTVINAYAGPSLRRYAVGLDQRLRADGLASPILLMKSDGGPASIESAASTAAQTVYSGPAAGVVASKLLGDRLKLGNLITFDMGGTSTDVGIIYDGEIQTTSAQQLDRQPLATPMIDVTSVGAGGGSLGALAVDASLQVGPASAGALPGPACYQRGGTEPAVTDANVVLGLIDPDYFLGGSIKLDAQLARNAVTGLADKVGLDPEATAFGMFRVVNSVMADAIRLRTVFAGLDPREFTLVSFGGAGGLHCAAVAADLGIRRIVVPDNASVFSAVGLVSSDLVYSLARSKQLTIDPGGRIAADSLAEINGIFADLDARATEELDQHEIPPARRELHHTVEMSYLGQILNFQVELPAGELKNDDIQMLVKTFDERYAKVYGPGAAAPEFGYVIKTYKTVGVGRITAPASGLEEPEEPRAPVPPKSTRRALADVRTGEIRDISVYDPAAFLPGARVTGPGILEFPDTTVLVPTGFTARLDGSRNVIVEQASS